MLGKASMYALWDYEMFLGNTDGPDYFDDPSGCSFYHGAVTETRSPSNSTIPW